MGLIAERLVHQHEGTNTEQREWLAHGPTCLNHLQVSDTEVEHWVDELHPAFEAVQLG